FCKYWTLVKRGVRASPRYPSGPNAKIHLDVPTRGIGVRADLMCLLNNAIGFIGRHTGQHDMQTHSQAIGLADGTDTNLGLGVKALGELCLAGCRYSPHRANEAGRIAGGK